tara:strand:- start:2579 stop:3160 length:582 start_codon:yes stop_codon:yes gene_type:complete
MAKVILGKCISKTNGSINEIDPWDYEVCLHLYGNKRLVDRMKRIPAVDDVYLFIVIGCILAHADIKVGRSGRPGGAISQASKLQYFEEIDAFFNLLTDEELADVISEVKECYVGDYLEPMDFVEEDFERRFPAVLEKLKREGATNYINWDKVRDDTELDFVFVSIPTPLLPDDFKHDLCFVATYVFRNYDLQP